MSRIKDYYDEEIRALSRDNGPMLDADYCYDEFLQKILKDKQNDKLTKPHEINRSIQKCN